MTDHMIPYESYECYIICHCTGTCCSFRNTHTHRELFSGEGKSLDILKPVLLTRTCKVWKTFCWQRKVVTTWRWYVWYQCCFKFNLQTVKVRHLCMPVCQAILKSYVFDVENLIGTMILAMRFKRIPGNIVLVQSTASGKFWRWLFPTLNCQLPIAKSWLWRGVVPCHRSMRHNLMLMIHTGSLGPHRKASRTIHVVGRFSASSETFVNVKRSKSFLVLRFGEIMEVYSLVFILYLYVPAVIFAAQPHRLINEPMVHHLHTSKWFKRVFEIMKCIRLGAMDLIWLQFLTTLKSLHFYSSKDRLGGHRGASDWNQFCYLK